MGRGLQKGRGVVSEVLSPQNGGGGAKKDLAMLKVGGGRGDKRFWSSFNTGA